MVSVIIPTLNAEEHIHRLLISLRRQSISCEIIIIDSSSSDDTVKIAESYGVKPIIIKREDFDHGGTRNFAANISSGDILIFLTQDAVPYDTFFIENLIKPLCNNLAVASFGRQIPRDDAKPTEHFARLFNYPDTSVIKTIADIEDMGIKTFFFSNVCSAIKKKEMKEVGFFSKKAILNEDMILAAKLILKSYSIAYVHDACVQHSHNYNLMDQFRRYFDIGVSFSENKWLQIFATPHYEGYRYIKGLFNFISKNAGNHWLIYAFIETICKFTGYRLGLISQNIPLFIKRIMSFHPHYFRSPVHTDTQLLKETPKPLQVLQVTSAMEGGIRKHLISILKGLDKERFSQRLVFSTYYMDNNFLKEFPNLISNELLLPLKIRKYPSIMDFVNIFKIVLMHRNLKFDIIHGHGAKGGAYARIISRIVGIKSVYTPHGGSLHPVFGTVLQKIFNAAEKIMFYLTDKFVFESNYSLNRYLTIAPKARDNKMVVNYNGVTIPERIHPHNTRNVDTFTIGLFGLLRHLKGQDVFIDALPFLLTEFNNIVANIYGDGPDRKLLETKVKDLKLCDIVHFHGDVSDTEEYMKKCDLIVHPSRHEALGYTIIEAMSLAKPAVATNVGGIKEVVMDGETGTLVPPDNPYLLAQAIARYIKEPALCIKHGLAARLRVENVFSEKGMIENLAAVYSNLTKNK